MNSWINTCIKWKSFSKRYICRERERKMYRQFQCLFNSLPPYFFKKLRACSILRPWYHRTKKKINRKIQFPPEVRFFLCDFLQTRNSLGGRRGPINGLGPSAQVWNWDPTPQGPLDGDNALPLNLNFYY